MTKFILFVLVSLLALLWLFGGSALAWNSTLHDPNPYIPMEGRFFGALAGVLFYVCTGVPVLIFSGWWAWLSRPGRRAERRHHETIEATKDISGLPQFIDHNDDPP
jgi:uncharacterized iron-regulated membrane protein